MQKTIKTMSAGDMRAPLSMLFPAPWFKTDIPRSVTSNLLFTTFRPGDQDSL